MHLSIYKPPSDALGRYIRPSLSLELSSAQLGYSMSEYFSQLQSGVPNRRSPKQSNPQCSF